MAHPKHDLIRRRFQGRCGYCGVSENESGGELTVDHFVSRSAGGDDRDENLVYACFRCNLYKQAYEPPSDDPATHLLHPQRDKVENHLLLDVATCELKPLTARGANQISILHLNRPALVAYRVKRQLDSSVAAEFRLLQGENRELRRLVERQDDVVDESRRDLGAGDKTNE